MKRAGGNYLTMYVPESVVPVPAGNTQLIAALIGYCSPYYAMTPRGFQICGAALRCCIIGTARLFIRAARS